MRNSKVKLQLPNLHASLDLYSDWPKSCPLPDAELGGYQTMRYEFANKHSGQMFEVVLRKQGGTMQFKEFEMKLLS